MQYRFEGAQQAGGVLCDCRGHILGSNCQHVFAGAKERLETVNLGMFVPVVAGADLLPVQPCRVAVIGGGLQRCMLGGVAGGDFESPPEKSCRDRGVNGGVSLGKPNPVALAQFIFLFARRIARPLGVWLKMLPLIFFQEFFREANLC